MIPSCREIASLLRIMINVFEKIARKDMQVVGWIERIGAG